MKARRDLIIKLMIMFDLDKPIVRYEQIQKQ